MRILVLCPGAVAGGANLLIGRAALRLHRDFGHQLILVDFEGGAIHRYFQAAGIPFEFTAYEVGRRVRPPAADAIMLSLLGVKILDERCELPASVRLLAWCTAPQDVFKFIPVAYFFNQASWTARRRLLRWVFPAHARRIAGFLREGVARGGVIFMDRHNQEVNELLFDESLPGAVVPLCTDDPGQPMRAAIPRTGKAYWVGRVTDFKTESLLGFVREWRRIPEGAAIREVVVIGDGADLEKAQCALAGLPVRWAGYLPPAELDREIRAEADFVFGHATSLLEAAKQGIPSLMVDATYDPIAPGVLRVEWLHRCAPGYVGQITRPEAFNGRPLGACLSELAADPDRIGRADFEHWRRHHSPASIAGQLDAVLRRNQYTLGDLRASGAVRPGWCGCLLEWVKRRVFRRQY